MLVTTHIRPPNGGLILAMLFGILSAGQLTKEEGKLHIEVERSAIMLDAVNVLNRAAQGVGVGVGRTDSRTAQVATFPFPIAKVSIPVTLNMTLFSSTQASSVIAVTKSVVSMLLLIVKVTLFTWLYENRGGESSGY